MGDSAYGFRIRRLREERGMSLRELSREAEISPGSLSSIENEQSSPTLATLQKVLRAMNIGFAGFFTDSDEESLEPVTARADMQVVEDERRRYVLALPRNDDLRFQILDETISPAEADEEEWEVHDFDVGGLLLEGGPMRLEIAGQGTWTVESGAAFYVKAGERHRGINVGRKAIRLISVASPPRY